MASSGDGRSGLLTAGGVLSIVAGALQIIGGLIMVAIRIGIMMLLRGILCPDHAGRWFEGFLPILPAWLGILGVPLIVLGIVAIIGGISALRKKSWGLSLAGAICALPSNILGILAIIFVSLSKKEFEAEK